MESFRKLREMLASLRTYRAKAAAEHTMMFYLVRTGAYDLPGPFRLTPTGVFQVGTAAREIQIMIGSNPVKVLQPRSNKMCYWQTVAAIAAQLGVITTPYDHMYIPGVYNISRLEQDFPGIQQFVLVIDGSSLRRLLKELPGPPVDLRDTMGPPEGSVHKLELVYRRVGGSSVEVSRQFVR